MADACLTYQDGISLCDIETTVAESIPYIHIARVIHKILGFVLIVASCWKLSTTRLILLYWVLFEMLEIYEPFISGKSYPMHMSNVFFLSYTTFSTNNWLLDNLTVIAGFIVCTSVWPSYA